MINLNTIIDTKAKANVFNISGGYDNIVSLEVAINLLLTKDINISYFNDNVDFDIICDMIETRYDELLHFKKTDDYLKISSFDDQHHLVIHSSVMHDNVSDNTDLFITDFITNETIKIFKMEYDITYYDHDMCIINFITEINNNHLNQIRICNQNYININFDELEFLI